CGSTGASWNRRDANEWRPSDSPKMTRGSRSPCVGYAAHSETAVLSAVAQHLHGLAARVLAAPGQPGHPAELLEHLLHLHELLQQTIHVFDRRSAALRDPLAPAAIDDVLLAPLFRRHRADDRLDPRNLLLVRLVLRERLEVAHPGQHPHDLLERPHLPDRLQLIPEVLERKVVGAELLFELLRVLDV